MSRKFRELSERQIRKAEAEGEGKLSNLEGEGKPLPDRPGDALIDAGLAAGHRIMAEAGVVPEEFTLKKQLDAARAAYALRTNPEDRKSAMKRIADLELRYHIAQDARRKFMR